MKWFLKWTLMGLALVIGISMIIGLILGPEDSCLDSGGCWDSTDKVCRKTEPDAQALCDRPKPK
jgi:hypothetical protein